MKLYSIVLFASASVLTACDQTGPIPENSVMENTPGFSTISLVEINDLHAHLTEHMDYTLRDGKPIMVRRGGLARIATAIKEIKQENPQNIIMNIGDTYHGGVEALYTSGNAIVDPVNALGIDIGVPGNWDFAYGPAVTRARYSDGQNRTGLEIKKTAFQNLAANVTSLTRQAFLPASKIITINGIDIGFIGLTSDIVPRMFSGFAIGFDFLQGKQNYIDLIETHASELRSRGADVVVVMSELGIHKDIALADSVAEDLVDVFFSAHTHELTREPVMGKSGAMVVEAGNDTYLGRMDLVFDAEKNLQDRQWSIIEIDSRISRDRVIEDMVAVARQPFLGDNVYVEYPVGGMTPALTQSVDTVIATLPYTVDRRQVLSNSFNQMFTGMLRQYAGTDVAMTSGFRFDSVIPGAGYLMEDDTIAPGEVTIEDVYRFFPVTIDLATAQITGKKLKEMIEANLDNVFSTDTFAHSGGWFDGFDGLELVLNLKQSKGTRVNSMKLSGSDTEIQDNDVLSIAGCIRPIDPGNSDVLCGYSDFTNVTDLMNPLTGMPWSAIDFLTAQLKSQQAPVDIENHITDLDETLVWPEGEYIQPLRGAQDQ